MSLKSELQADLDDVFFNTNEFAEPVSVFYDDETYHALAVVEQDNEAERSQSATDHSEGIFQVNVTAYFKYSELGFKPHRNHEIAIDGTRYEIVESMVENGMIVLKLWEFDE